MGFNIWECQRGTPPDRRTKKGVFLKLRVPHMSQIAHAYFN